MVDFRMRLPPYTRQAVCETHYEAVAAHSDVIPAFHPAAMCCFAAVQALNEKYFCSLFVRKTL